MIKYLTLTCGLFIISGCSTLDRYEKPSCYKSVAIAKISITEAHNNAAHLTTSKNLSLRDSKNTYIILEQANDIADNASALCSLDEVAASDYIEQVYKLIGNASNIMKGIK